MKLSNFVENSFKSHGYALFIQAKWNKTSDGLLSSEDLKEEKVVTTPSCTISPYSAHRFPSSVADKGLPVV
jgi:hypothetical protein